VIDMWILYQAPQRNQRRLPVFASKAGLNGPGGDNYGQKTAAFPFSRRTKSVRAGCDLPPLTRDSSWTGFRPDKKVSA
jgi:hypothetical protein